jgi:PST family polysaccharide transporter
MAWAGGSQFAMLLIQLPITIALSRLLAPRAFGLMAMIVVISGFLRVLVDAGLGNALIHLEDLEPRHVSTAFWMNLTLGVTLSIAVAGASPAFAALYDQPRLTALAAVTALDFTVGAFGIVQLALLRRQMRFRQIGTIQNSSVAVGGAAAIFAAALGAGVWSLVVNVLITTFVQAVLATRIGAARFKGGFDRAAARQLWSFSGHQMGFQAVNYWSRNADNFIIGKFVGAYGLGIYGRAYQLMMMPITRTGSVVTTVLFPALARMQGDTRRLKAAYLRAIGAAAFVSFPVVLALFALAPELVRILLGSRWLDVVPVLRILCVAGILQSIGTTTGVLYQACGRTDLLFRWGLASGAVTIVAFAIGVNWGVRGVASAYAIRTLALTYFNFSIPGRLIEMRYREVVAAAAGPLVLSAVMAAAMYGMGLLLPDALTGGGRIVCQIGVGALLYLAGARLGRLAAYGELRGLMAAR